jgi:putative ABC transport system permease protein
MGAMREACARFLSLFNARDLDREFDDEARSHLALATEDYVQRGMPLAEAQRLARVKFGAIAASRDAHRDSRGLPWLEALFYDLRFALRGLRRDRAFTLAAIAMLALAIGLNVTLFTVMNAFLFRGYPLVKENDRVVYLQEQFPGGRCCISYPDFEAWRVQAHAFQGMAFVGEREISLRDTSGHLIDMAAFTVSANAFSLLGVPPMLGRDFTPADEVAGASPVAILNYRVWESRFGKGADVVGAPIQIDGAPATIIGVMPERFDFPTQFDLWMPLVQTPELQQRGISHGYIAVGRLRDGVRLQEASAELETINQHLAADHPATNRGIVPRLLTHAEMISGPDARVIWGSLWLGAWFVLLIACANLANLSLVRTIGRWRDFSTRIALGAGQWRMVRQIGLESLTLTGVAGTIAWWLTGWSVHRWAVATASIYQILDYRVDGGTLTYLMTIAVAAAMLWSLAPIVRVLQIGASGALKGDARGVTHGLRGKGLQAGLVVVQMALAVVLLAGAGVLGRSFMNIVGADTGVRDPEHVLAGRLILPSENYNSLPKRVAYFDRLDAQLRTISGLQDISIANNVPGRGAELRVMEVEGHPTQPDSVRTAAIFTVGSGYFQVMGVPMLSGRDFNDEDGEAASKVAIVNERFAALFWPGDNPVGKRLRSSDRARPGEWHTVVGIAPNIMQGDPLRQGFKPVVYVSGRQYPMRAAYFFVRTRVPPDGVARTVRTEIQNLDPDVDLEELTTLKAHLTFKRDYMDAQHSELGKHAAIAPVFAVIALLLAAIGLYAVAAHSVSQRTKEIGVRIAIGAAPQDIRRLIFREGMGPVAMGLVLGLAASLAANRILQSQLVGVSPYDAVTMVGAPVVLIMVALLACQIPARRAMSVDPVVVLRHH